MVSAHRAPWGLVLSFFTPNRWVRRQVFSAIVPLGVDAAHAITRSGHLCSQGIDVVLHQIASSSERGDEGATHNNKLLRVLASGCAVGVPFSAPGHHGHWHIGFPSRQLVSEVFSPWLRWLHCLHWPPDRRRLRHDERRRTTAQTGDSAGNIARPRTLLLSFLSGSGERNVAINMEGKHGPTRSVGWAGTGLAAPPLPGCCTWPHS